MKILNEYFTNNDVCQYFSEIEDKYKELHSALSDLAYATIEHPEFRKIGKFTKYTINDLEEFYRDNLSEIKLYIEELTENEEEEDY